MSPSEEPRSQPAPRPGPGVPAAIRGTSPKPPALPPRHAAAERERLRELQGREVTERRSMLRGLWLLAIVVIVLAVVQFGWSRAFPAGWWHRW